AATLLTAHHRPDASWWKLALGIVIVHVAGYNLYLWAKGRLLNTRSRSMIQDLVLAVIPQFLLLCTVLGQPLGPAGDFLGLCLPLMLAVYRIGCLVSGCCYGRPNPNGIRYRAEQVQRASTRFRHFDPGPCPPGPVSPLQLVDAVAHLAAFTAVLLTALHSAGVALLPVYLLTYCVLRLPIDARRGHRHRPTYGPLSESQWTALLVAVVATTWLTVSLLAR
ncbi:MAG: prolipoprotein diacylglyceryl transferase family protein, partial [Kibdelosporangium sp.]